MILKQSIEQVFKEQQLLLDSSYLEPMERNFLADFSPSQSHIEVISGIRRCGKSTLMSLIRKQFYPGAAYFNFEDSRIFGFDIYDFQMLDEVIPKNTPAYFFDEIQNVENWEVFIRQLHDRGSKVFITGSNASLLSRELGTRLTGRHLRHELYPFSYTEYLTYKKFESSAESFSLYLNEGGFPEYLNQKDPLIHQNLFKDIILRDIAVRNGIRNTQVLMELALFLISNVGNETTYNSLRKQFNMGAANTALDYIHWLEDSWLIFQLQRFSWSLKARSANPRKIYGIDIGLIKSNTLSGSPDAERHLENAVFLLLKRKGLEIYYFRENKECDFVVMDKGKCKYLIQVCNQITPDNQERELSGLVEAMNYFDMNHGLIITTDQRDDLTKDGKSIQLIPAWEFFI